jgi:hypothetical protein
MNNTGMATKTTAAAPPPWTRSLAPDVVPFAEILLAGLPVPAARPIVCAWCPDFDPRNPAHRGASHGICAPCAIKLLAGATS